MSADIEANLSKLESKELIYKINNSLLTVDAHTAALKVLSERGVDTTTLKQWTDEITDATAFTTNSDGSMRTCTRTGNSVFCQ